MVGRSIRALGQRGVRVNEACRAAIRGLDGLLSLVALLATVVMMFAIAAGAVARYVADEPLTGLFGLTESYLLPMSFFLALGLGYRKRSHVRVTLVVDRLSGRSRLGAAYLAQLVSMVAIGALALASITQALEMFDAQSRTSGSLSLPLWPAYAVVAVGFASLFLLMLADIWPSRAGRSRLVERDDESQTAGSL